MSNDSCLASWCERTPSLNIIYFLVVMLFFFIPLHFQYIMI